MLKHLIESISNLSSLDGEEFQVALRMAYNDLKDQKESFDQFVREAAPARILEYSYLHLLFAQMIVSELSAESDRRCEPPNKPSSFTPPGERMGSSGTG
jgi:hypothetical protein